VTNASHSRPMEGDCDLDLKDAELDDPGVNPNASADGQ
jgi:hypothetical protein